MNTYKVELPDGRVVSKNSSREFTYAVAIKWTISGNEETWGCLSWAGDKYLAEKVLTTYQNKVAKSDRLTGTELQIVKVGA
jgi:hypothetical protein